MASLDQDEDVHSRSHSESSDDSDSQDPDDMRKEAAGPRKTADGKVKKPANKDPNRVKRKKARRACENCQRAHLTCSKSPILVYPSYYSIFILRFVSCSTGDQRPCERCGDKKPCRDGKRKKAKYLEGTKDEDLTPSQEKEAEEQERQRAMNRYPGLHFPGPSFPGPRPGGLYQVCRPTAAPGYPMFPSSNQNMHMNPQSFVNQRMSTAQPQPFMYSQQPTLLESFGSTSQPNNQVPPGPMPNLFAGDPFPEFDNDQMGFDNKFGALEFNMLNEMSSGLADTPPSDNVGGFEPTDSIIHGLPTEFGSSPTAAQQWSYSQPVSSQGAIAYNVGGQEHDRFDGFVKQEEMQRSYAPQSSSKRGPSSYPSPSSGPSPQGMMMAGFEGNPTTKEASTNNNPSHQAQEPQEAQALQPPTASATSASVIPAATTSTIPATTMLVQTFSSRRGRNPSTVYNMVTVPYSYTKAFHDLMALIRNRFSQKRTAQIAKALASIRPSFISSLTNLDDDDRVFMEKCLQRTLLEYEDNLSLTGTPTLLCRRTGEVVAVSEGFTILTGWRKAILLGKEPNLNVNKGGDTSSPPGPSASNSRGTNTPRIPDGSSLDDLRPKPVSIVELLDDESACDFFEDYAHLAFGDSRGSVTTPCKFVRYKTAKDKDLENSLDSEVGSRLKRQRDANHVGRRGENSYKVDCMLCWSVKRDVFNIPMLFVMNILPCI